MKIDISDSEYLMDIFFDLEYPMNIIKPKLLIFVTFIWMSTSIIQCICYPQLASRLSSVIPFIVFIISMIILTFWIMLGIFIIIPIIIKLVFKLIWELFNKLWEL